MNWAVVRASPLYVRVGPTPRQFLFAKFLWLARAAGSEISSGMNAEEKRLMLKQSIEARYTRVNKLKAHALP